MNLFSVYALIETQSSGFKSSFSRVLSIYVQYIYLGLCDIIRTEILTTLMRFSCRGKGVYNVGPAKDVPETHIIS